MNSSNQQNLGRKRPHTLISAAEQQGNPLNCKICLQIFTEPYITICGHTFCQTCIIRSLQHNPQCPVCDTTLDLKRQKTICPNHTVATLIEQNKCAGLQSSNRQETNNNIDAADARILQLIRAQTLSLESVKRITDELKKRQLELELNDQQIRNVLLHEFLDRIIEKRESAAKNIQIELDLLKQDKQRVLNTLTGQLSPSSIQRLVPDAPNQSSLPISSPQNASMLEPGEGGSGAISTTTTRANSPAQLSPALAEQLGKYRRRLNRHMNSLECAYFGGGSSSRNVLNNGRETEPLVGSNVVMNSKVELDEFSEMLRRMYQYGDMKVLATLNYNFESTNALSIVSSIEFDKDGEFFVIAGVTKKIKLYNYESVVNFEGDMYYPEEQLICNSKISNVSWNPYNKNILASSDYEGTVQIWDTKVGQSTRTYKEHEKRCWTVQFNNVDPHLMASGSDDGKVKLWTLNAPQSVCTIDAKVNVCCVYFSPKYRDQLVFGSSDHCVHLYDIRKPNKALNIFRGHRKAVSYVKYCNANEVVSASTDSNLRVWDVNSGKCLQTMKGHQNEKNFVGMATDGTHVVCGSENNRLYLYYKMVQDPLLSFDCDSRSVDALPSSAHSTTMNGENTGSNTPIESGGQTTNASPISNDFVSAVCWKKNSNVILAANSQGQTFVLQLQ